MSLAWPECDFHPKNGSVCARGRTPGVLTARKVATFELNVPAVQVMPLSAMFVGLSATEAVMPEEQTPAVTVRQAVRTAREAYLYLMQLAHPVPFKELIAFI